MSRVQATTGFQRKHLVKGRVLAWGKYSIVYDGALRNAPRRLLRMWKSAGWAHKTIPAARDM